MQGLGEDEAVYFSGWVLSSVAVLDDRFHEIGIDGTGNMLVDSSFETERGVVSWQDGVRRSSWR